jgi:hypothetical protein
LRADPKIQERFVKLQNEWKRNNSGKKITANVWWELHGQARTFVSDQNTGKRSVRSTVSTFHQSAIEAAVFAHD